LWTEWRERPLDHNNRGFLNWNPTTEHQMRCPVVPTQSIFPRAFQAHQEDDISFWVEKGQMHLAHPIAESFEESKISRPVMCITQSVVVQCTERTSKAGAQSIMRSPHLKITHFRITCSLGPLAGTRIASSTSHSRRDSMPSRRRRSLTSGAAAKPSHDSRSVEKSGPHQNTSCVRVRSAARRRHCLRTLANTTGRIRPNARRTHRGNPGNRFPSN
jgi:hypothetical protein